MASEESTETRSAEEEFGADVVAVAGQHEHENAIDTASTAFTNNPNRNRNSESSNTKTITDYDICAGSKGVASSTLVAGVELCDDDDGPSSSTVAAGLEAVSENDSKKKERRYMEQIRGSIEPPSAESMAGDKDTKVKLSAKRQAQEKKARGHVEQIRDNEGPPSVAAKTEQVKVASTHSIHPPLPPGHVAAAYEMMYVENDDEIKQRIKRDMKDGDNTKPAAIRPPLPPTQVAAAFEMMYEEDDCEIKQRIKREMEDGDNTKPAAIRPPLPPSHVAAAYEFANDSKKETRGHVEQNDKAVDEDVYQVGDNILMENAARNELAQDRDSIIVPTREDIEDDVLQHEARYVSPRRVRAVEDMTRRDASHHQVGASLDVNDPSPDLETGISTRSAIKIPEAWAVVGDEPRAERDDPELVMAIQMPTVLPWWKQNQNRLYSWALLCFFSIIALTAYQTNPDHEERRTNLVYWGWWNWDTFITTCSSVSIAVSALASVAHISRNNVISRRFVGTIFEGIATLAIGACWGTALFLISDANQELALNLVSNGSGSSGRVADFQQNIQDGNLYFSSWGALICALILFCMYMEEQRERVLKCFRVSGRYDGMGMGYTIKWILLLLVSVVVVIECNNFRSSVCAFENRTEDATCDRNSWGVLTGLIGIVISAFMSIFSYLGRDSALDTTAIGLVMVINYIACAGLLCFGYGPATTTGNQFFSVWAGVFLSLSLFGGALKEYLIQRGNGDIQENLACTRKRLFVISSVFVATATIVGIAFWRTDATRGNGCSGIECFPNCNVDLPWKIADGICDGGHNTEECGWDGGDCTIDNYPDCHVDYPETIGDGECNFHDPYNTEECGWDGGDCIEVNQRIAEMKEKYPACPHHLSVGDGHCDGWYNTEECGWDGGDCAEFNQKYPDCNVDFPSSIGDGHCEGGLLNTEECGWDGGDCAEFNKKYPNCQVDYPKSIGNGECDNHDQYNTEDCGWDGGDCEEFNRKYPGCYDVNPEHIGDGHCQGYEYNTEECRWDGGDCAEFNQKYPDCRAVYPGNMGDGYCDGGPYNTEECNWDDGDCDEFNRHIGPYF